jgi:hypothetical protein
MIIMIIIIIILIIIIIIIIHNYLCANLTAQRLVTKAARVNTKNTHTHRLQKQGNLYDFNNNNNNTNKKYKDNKRRDRTARTCSTMKQNWTSKSAVIWEVTH